MWTIGLQEADETASVFWDNRVAAADPPLRPQDTRIPEAPDQSDFLERWFEFHQGYRTVTHEDGSHQKIAVVGEPFKDVSPGQMPRTLDELRSNHAGLGSGAANGRPSRTNAIPAATARDTEPEVSLDETLDELLDEASIEGATHRGSNTTPRADHPQPVPPPNDLDDRLNEARAQLQEATSARARAAADLEAAESEVRIGRERLRRLERQRRTAENYTRVFGTREDVERQGEAYESPIGGMFTRAWGRYSQAEASRRDGHALPSDPWFAARALAPRHAPGAREADLQRALLESLQGRPAQAAAAGQGRGAAPASPVPGLDGDERPPPKTDAEMTVVLSCQVCYAQLADTVVLPCGHLAMCEWCADQTVPVHQNDRTRPRGRVDCPVCRQRVTMRRRVSAARDLLRSWLVLMAAQLKIYRA